MKRREFMAPRYAIVRIGILTQHRLTIQRILRRNMRRRRAERVCKRLNVLASRTGKPSLYAVAKLAESEATL